MKNILMKFLAVLGMLFCLQLVALAYFYITDPYNLKPLFFGGSQSVMVPAHENESTNADSSADSTNTTTVATAGFTLSAVQKQALVNLGIDPATVPSKVTKEQEDCFVTVLGVSRVGEIKAGAVPTPMEFLRAKECI